MGPWKKALLLRIEQFGKIPQRSQRGEINESAKKTFINKTIQ